MHEDNSIAPEVTIDLYAIASVDPPPRIHRVMEYGRLLAQQSILLLGAPAVATAIVVFNLVRNDYVNWLAGLVSLFFCILLAAYQAWEIERFPRSNVRSRWPEFVGVLLIGLGTVIAFIVGLQIERVIPYAGIDLSCSFDHRATPDGEWEAVENAGVVQLASLSGGSTAIGFGPHSYLTCVANNYSSEPIYKVHFRFSYAIEKVAAFRRMSIVQQMSI